MKRDEIKNLIPHREPMLLVDEVELIDGKARAKYTVRGDEWFLDGHFPGAPVVPGVMLCEIAGQSSCILFKDKISGKIPMFTGIKKVKFRSPARPGDILDIECGIIGETGNFSFIESKIHVGERLCMQGEFSFALVSEV